METRTVPDDIARGGGSFWLWLNKEFGPKALIGRGEVSPSSGATDPIVRRTAYDVGIIWNGLFDSQKYSLTSFPGSPNTSDLEKMARARIAKREYPPEDPVEEASESPPLLSVVEEPDLSGVHREMLEIVREGRPNEDTLPTPDAAPAPKLDLVEGATLRLPPSAILDEVGQAQERAARNADGLEALAKILHQLDSLHSDYRRLCGNMRDAGYEVTLGPDGKHTVPVSMIVIPPHRPNRPT